MSSLSALDDLRVCVEDAAPLTAAPVELLRDGPKAVTRLDGVDDRAVRRAVPEDKGLGGDAVQPDHRGSSPDHRRVHPRVRYQRGGGMNKEHFRISVRDIRSKLVRLFDSCHADSDNTPDHLAGEPGWPVRSPVLAKPSHQPQPPAALCAGLYVPQG